MPNLFPISSRKRRGFSLVEVLLALAVLGMGILTILGLLTAAFESVGSNLQTSQALGVYAKVDRALSNVSEFTGTDRRPLYPQSQLNKPSFDYIYDWIRDKKGKSWDDALFVVCYSQRLNPDDDRAPQRAMSLIKAESSNALPTRNDLGDYEGNVYLVRIFISPQLEGRRIEMNTNGEVMGNTYTIGSSLPANPDSYALPYLPVTIEIYPYIVGANSQPEDQTPIFSQMLVITR